MIGANWGWRCNRIVACLMLWGWGEVKGGGWKDRGRECCFKGPATTELVTVSLHGGLPDWEEWREEEREGEKEEERDRKRKGLNSGHGRTGRKPARDGKQARRRN